MATAKMKKDLEVFKSIRLAANSGLYKYRTKKQIDSIYNWAEHSIEKITTHGEFYNLICTLTDYEGSLHNDTEMPKKSKEELRKETSGYFPFPIKWIAGQWRINYENETVPLGSAVIAINGISIAEIITNLNKYYTTDGINLTGKRIGIRTHFAKYYRLHYGLTERFIVEYKTPNATTVSTITLNSVSYAKYYTNYRSRYTKPYEQSYKKVLKEDRNYNYKKIDSVTGILTLNTFNIGGNAEAPEHLKFVAYLEKIFSKIKVDNIKNLIVDIRNNGGGTDPNELVAYSYLTQRNFSENKSAWVSFQKIPYLKYIETKVPTFLRFLGVIKYNKYFQKEFPVVSEGQFYQGTLSEDHKIRVPNKNAFTGNIYLLIGPKVASAGSNFGALLASNTNTLTIGEETMGGYYGHNGHTPISYILPKSKIITTFSVVNLEQYVVQKENQIHNRGIIPDVAVSQTYEDFIHQIDSQLNYTLKLIARNHHK